MNFAPLSPLAKLPLKFKDGETRKGEVYGLVVHTTGSTIVEKAQKLKRVPLDFAVEYYLRPDSYWSHYVIGWDGTIVQLSNEITKCLHVGWSAQQRDWCMSGTWREHLPENVVELWEKAWPGVKSPAHLYPGTSPNQVYCLAPETRVLSADLRWRAIGDLLVGAELVGFDESLAAHNKLRRATVLDTLRVKKPCVRVVTSHGSVICSEDHLWVVRRYQGNKSDGTYRKKALWAPAKSLKVGQQLCMLGVPWEDLSQTVTGAYLAGFFDGEGSVGKSGGVVGFCQNPGAVLDKVLGLLRVEKFLARKASHPQRRCQVYELTGNRAGMQFLGAVQPVRLMLDSSHTWEGRRVYGRKTPQPKVLAVEAVGERWVCAVQTSTKTMIAEGFLSHNCGVEMLPTVGTMATLLGRPYTKEQHVAIKNLANDIAKRWHWPEGWSRSGRLVGHEDVNPFDRHDKGGGWDPGGLRDRPRFDWTLVR